MKKIFFLTLLIVLLGVGCASFVFPERESATLTNEKCLARGMVRVQTGCGIGNCMYKCVKKYADAGKDCTSSNDCDGQCVLTSPALDDFGYKDVFPYKGSYQYDKECKGIGNFEFTCKDLPLAGNCEELPPANCEGRWILEDKNIKFIKDRCEV